MPSVSRVLHYSRRMVCVLMFAAGTFASGPAAADDAPARCQGKDMLAEMQATKPDLYAKVMAESRALSNTEAMLWKVEKPGVGTSYLFGTMHLSDPRIAELPSAAIEAIAHSKSVALEVADLSPEAVGAAMTKAAKLIIYTDGQSLRRVLSDDDYNKVQDIVMKSGMPGEFAAVMKPWLVSMLLATSDCERKQVASGKAVLDLRIAAEAQKNGIAVTGLETIDSQLSALASIADDQQLAILKVELDYADRADDMMETMVQMYQKRQIGAAMPFQLALAAESGAPPSTFDGFKKALLMDRNAKMRDAALPLFENGNAFVAVGALHLPGSAGLVALLRESGYTVTPIE
ncbi:TraB/GumN family protein [Hyphomicrobium sp. 99]|uniref:TraB/GumN family protein n=1 Tax=Hyphomicrobium sp. 99 TaxID=1163419 RepID=UPI0009E19CB2|nr:TraB/GumN family protein [Hyphomicrobium sp. 99]